MSDVLTALATALSDRYRFERELGRGGMATVFLAEDLRHRRPVAVKVLRPEVASAIGPARFLREIEIAARLTHPHILPLHDSGVAGDHLFYVTPYIEGETLRERIARERQLPLEDAVRIAREIASALGYAHGQGVVHRDIKPENVLLSDGMALVADFGVARSPDGPPGTGLTTQGTAIGTPAYMAPEQVTGSPNVDGRADLYALGCVLFEMLAGSTPFTGPSESLAYQHLSVPPRAVSELRPGVPPQLSATIARALAKSPADRPASAAHFAEALATAWLEEPPADPADPRARPNNLPAERTRFVGRDKERATCLQWLDDARLLTLTGIGGCGKTRLALKLAEDCLERFPDGVWFVDLAPVTDGSRVAGTVGTALGVREQAGVNPLDGLRLQVRGRILCVVLDNCEHLLPACGVVVDALLDADPGVRVVATSREGLGVVGERIYALSPLAVPPVERSRDLDVVGTSEAVRLFVERAQLVQPGFALGQANAEAIAEITRRLDGIPLALELAAARVRILSVEQIRDRLDDRFRLLTGGRGALPRHQTLRATIQWSDEQLTPDEQRLFRQLAVFAGGWTLEAATRVAGAPLDEFDVMDLLSRLVDKSLVIVARQPGREPRYGMLETVRQYGQDRLVEAGEAEAARRRHFDEYRALAERAYCGRFAREAFWSEALELERDNLGAALDHARATNADDYLELSGALGWYWQSRSHLHEGERQLRAALAAAASRPPCAARARALLGAGNILARRGDTATTLPMMHEALDLWRELGARDEIGAAIEAIGWVQLLGGTDLDARASFEEALRIQEEAGDPVLVNRAKVGFAQVLSALGETERVRPMAREIVAFSSSIQDTRSEFLGWHFLADAALIEGRCDESLGLYRQSLTLALRIDDRFEACFELQGIAMSLAGCGDAAGALRLAGAAQAEWDRMGADTHVRFWDALLERYLGAAREALGAAAAETEWQRGRAIPFDTAARSALADAAAPGTLEAAVAPARPGEREGDAAP